jgi:N utilization substance protein B
VSRQRSKARSLAVQAIYQWQMAGQNVADILAYFMAEYVNKKVDANYFRGLLQGVTRQVSRLDTLLRPHTDRAIDSVDPVERAILRIAVYELLEHPEIPYKVILNEAVDLAKTYGAEQGHKYVNGVLDKVAKEARALEVSIKS